jgi:predicted nucleic acid-binding protein
MADSVGGHGNPGNRFRGSDLGCRSSKVEGGNDGRPRADPVSAARVEIGLLDTSAFVAAEEGRPLREEALPDSAVISIITVAELRAGVLAASDIESRDRRLATLERISSIAVFPIDHHVAGLWAGMRTYLAAAGKRVSVNDLWIAATAAANRMPVVTQDRDFYALSGVNGLTVIEV